MAKGKWKSVLLGIQGLVGHRQAPDYSFIYETSLTKNAKWEIGDRVVLPDGRVFRYAKATNVVADLRQGVKFYNLQSDGVSYKAATTCAIGDTEITIDAGDSGDYTADQLRGGYLIIHTHGNKKHQFRGIIGNTVSDADGNITIYLDAPLTHTITTSHGVEVFANPYSSVRHCSGDAAQAGDRYSSVAGVPAVHTTAANQYLWIQTWGPCWCNPHGDLAGGQTSAADDRQVVFDFEGSISFEQDCNGAGGDGYEAFQAAGFVLDRNSSAITSGGFFMLQISP